jgi:hypothetical protein
MSELASPTEATESKSESKTEIIETAALVSRPHNLLYVFIWVVATFGIYLSVYYYNLGRDLRRIDGKRTSPWLWFLVPFLFVALPFATGNATRRIEISARSRGIVFRNRGFFLGSVAVLAALVQSAFELTTDSFSVTSYFVLLVVWAAIFVILSSDLKAYKLTLSEERFIPSSNSVEKLQLVGVVLAAIWIPTIFWLSASQEIKLAIGNELPAGVRWHHPEHPFSVSTNGKWILSGVGDFSDGSAEAEFAMVNEWHAIIFDQSGDGNFGEHVAGRRTLIRESDATARCVERRWLKSGSLTRYSELLCTSTSMGGSVIEISTNIENGVLHYEVYAKAVTKSRNVGRAISSLQDFTAGFRLEPVNKDALL